MKILVAVPTYETIAPETFKSIYDLAKADNEVSFEFVKGYDCPTARNNIAQMAVDGDYDYVLMVDSDVIVPQNALECLLDPPGNIVLGCCPRKNSTDGRIEIYRPGTFSFTDYFTYNSLPESDRVTVKGGGFACALVNVSVFKLLPFPWFKYVTYEDGSSLSEDLYFCIQANEAGFEVEADTRVRCGHLARYFQW